MQHQPAMVPCTSLQITSRISKEIEEMGGSTMNTVIPMNFLTSRMSSWQAHLQRLSPYFLPGKGVWWQTTEEGYKFLDGTAEPAERCEGPPLHHFRDTTLEQVYKQKESIQQQIIEKRVVLPVPYIKLYDAQGFIWAPPPLGNFVSHSFSKG